jgi:ABC-type transport system involved in multi-copper enzyme maturation permease subunit
MNGLAPLFVEAVRDAVRRRIAAGIVVVCVISVMMLDRCTGCGAGELVVNGEARPLASLAGGVGVATLLVLGLWVVALAGVLGADHLSQTLDDGSARMALARPVSRGTFALARLGGVLAIALAAGGVLIGTAGFLLATRSDLPVAPALAAGIACALGCVVAASLAMAASLALPRAATVLLVFAAVAAVAVANATGVASSGAPASGWLGAIDRLGPPFATAMLAPLSAWLPQVALAVDPTAVLVRLLAWAVGGVAALWAAFRRIEL